MNIPRRRFLQLAAGAAALPAATRSAFADTYPSRPVHLVAGFAACSKSDSGGDDKGGTPSTGTIGEINDSSEAGSIAFVKEQSYASWETRQPTAIKSNSAHGGFTRTYFNETAAAAARAGTVPLPKGSVIVKELFDESGTTLTGHAFMAKSTEGAAGETWLWFEGFKEAYANPYYGMGHKTCTGCHSAGKDFVQTAVPQP